MLTSTRRTLLESRLSEASCAIVAAPAGFGKSTTVRNALSQPRHDAPDRVVWVELGTPFRTDVVTAGEGFARALGQLGVDVGAQQPLEPSGSSDAATIDMIAAGLTAVGGQATVVLDDFHRLAPVLAAQLAAILASWSDDRRQVIVCTRMGRSALDAIWPLHEASIVVGPEEIKLTADEIAELLGVQLEAHIEAVEQSTGGWPRAVEIIGRNLHLDPAAGFDAAICEIESVLAAEVFPLHDPDDLDVLTAVSLCERFTRGVADRASRHTGGALRLERLGRDTGLVSFDGSTFSVVPVYRHALVRRLSVTDPDAVRSTHSRIAEAWLDEPDSIHATIRAIGHLIDANEFERALGLIHQRWEQIYAASSVDLAMGLIDRLPMRYWAEDAGSVLLAGWASLLIGRPTRALELLQSQPLKSPVGAAIKPVIWARGVCWTTDPAEAIELIGQGRSRLDALGHETVFPAMRGADSAAAFHNVADGAEARALFLLGDLEGSIDCLDRLIKRPLEHRPASMAGLHAVAALVTAFRGDRQSAIEHLRVGGAIARSLGVENHYLMIHGDLATAVLAAWDADDAVIERSLAAAVTGASLVGAANLLRVCELVADLSGHPFSPPDPTMLERAAPLPFVDSQLAPRAARRLIDLGDHDGAARMIADVKVNELALSSWVAVLLGQQSDAEVRHWLGAQPAPSCAHAEVVRWLAEATVAEDPVDAVEMLGDALGLASERRMVGVVADAPTALWDRVEIRHLNQPLLDDARRRLSEGVRSTDSLRFSRREIELLRLMAQAASAAEIAERLYLSVNTVKWHKANIYRKLDVTGSRQAIARAQALRIVPSGDRFV